MSAEQDYLAACRRILEEGVWVDNARTRSRVKTVINLDMEYDCSHMRLPMLTTKKMAWKSAIAEMLGYLKGYNNAVDFRALGTKTWDANANATGWQNSRFCAGEDDMGYCYGAVGSRFKLPEECGVAHAPRKSAEFNQWLPVVWDLKNKIDNRREIVTFYHPGTMEMACLPPCMHTHTFSLLNDVLYLTSYQRSADMPLGVPFNMIQAAWLLMVMARITGNKPGKVFHKIVNAHIYENQIPMMEEQLTRSPLPEPVMEISQHLTSWEYLIDHGYVEDFTVHGYYSHPAITYPFTV